MKSQDPPPPLQRMRCLRGALSRAPPQPKHQRTCMSARTHEHAHTHTHMHEARACACVRAERTPECECARALPRAPQQADLLERARHAGERGDVVAADRVEVVLVARRVQLGALGCGHAQRENIRASAPVYGRTRTQMRTRVCKEEHTHTPAHTHTQMPTNTCARAGTNTRKLARTSLAAASAGAGGALVPLAAHAEPAHRPAEGLARAADALGRRATRACVCVCVFVCLCVRMRCVCVCVLRGWHARPRAPRGCNVSTCTRI